MVAERLSQDISQALENSFFLAGHCVICTEDEAGEEWSERFMDEYGLTALATQTHRLLKQADLVLGFDDPNLWLSDCKTKSVILNFSNTFTETCCGRTVVEGVSVLPVPELLSALPKDVDWTAFCGCFLSELTGMLTIDRLLYAKA